MCADCVSREDLNQDRGVALSLGEPQYLGTALPFQPHQGQGHTKANLDSQGKGLPGRVPDPSWASGRLTKPWWAWEVQYRKAWGLGEGCRLGSCKGNRRPVG